MILTFITGLVFWADLITKAIINEKIPQGGRVPVIKNKVYITHIKNEGTALGFLKDKKMLVNALSVFSLVSILRSTIKSAKSGDKSRAVSYSFILGGGLGNIYERITKKSVTDFLLIKVKGEPVFNLADFAIIFGFIRIMSRELRKKKP